MQKEVADTAGISEWTVLRAEGGASVRPPTARKIADALGVSVSDLQESPPVPLASAPSASPPPDVGAAEAGQREEATLLDDPRVREWLRERGAAWAAMPEETLREYVRGLDPDIDENGDPARIVGLVEELIQEEVKTHALLWAPKEYRALEPLLPTDPDAPAEEQRQQRREQVRRMRREVQRAYRRRVTALVNYANALARAQEAMGKSHGYFEPAVGATARREQMLEAAFAGQAAG